MAGRTPSDTPVFFDPSGRRARRLQFGAWVVAIAAILLLVGFTASLAITPQILPLVSQARSRPARTQAAIRHIRERRVAFDAPRSRSQPLPASARVVGAYFPPWQEGALDSLRLHAANLTHVYPAWLQIGPDGRLLRSVDWDPRTTPTTTPLMRVARAHHLRIVPTVSNADHSHFDSHRIELMLRTPGAAQAMTRQLVQFVDANDLAGLQLDIEFLDQAMWPAYEGWVEQLGRTLHARGKELSIAVQASDDVATIRALAHNADYVVAMAYDEHDTPGAPGPVASAGFVQSVLRTFSLAVPANKLVLGVGDYGYDWAHDGSEPQTVTNAEAIAEAAGYRDHEQARNVIDFDSTALEPTYTYTDEHNVGHEVWFLDAVTVANAMRIASHYNTRGAALWALGMEDDSTWRVFGRDAPARPDLRALTPPTEPEFIGDGELLTVRRPPSAGTRTYDINRHGGLIDEESYQTYPTSWLVARHGDAHGYVALTFDDGPDPRWTPAILDVLRRHHVNATFFMIGQSAVAYPDLVRRVMREGNEIGNHSFLHPNMAHVGPERVRLELTATQRAIESIIGRSTRLFRPPFNADADPSSDGELMPVWVANQEGYLAAGESIDPQDWELDVRTAEGVHHRLDSTDIVDSVVRQIDHGHAILLHDGGGDRSATVAAVDALITGLQARGYRFETMGQLAGLGENVTMPRLNAEDLRLAEIDNAFFTTWRGISAFIFWGFSAAIVLGLARIALMLWLASLRSRETAPSTRGLRSVDVLIAAHNEEMVIEATIRSVLASRDVDVRVLLVDDGSTDRTAHIVAEAFANEPRLLVLSKPNGGKASALNLALAHARTDIIVGIDADTQIAPDAISALTRHFDDPDVAAVAGNVSVGNRVNVITRWQAIEYITSQNIDRRALSHVNAITVVPGAIGAWRAEAVRAAGGYSADTLAEDMDLTWRLRRQGWRIANEPDAIAFTEAPATLKALMRQRFRWTFGTLQCLWKHRDAVFHYGWFGQFALPSLWLFQIALQVLAPLVDLQLLLALVGRGLGWLESLQHADIAPPYDPAIWLIVGIYVAFVALELAAALIAIALDDEDRGLLWLQPLQRFVYRQIMYIAVWQAVSKALAGATHAWGKLRRTGGVVVDLPASEPTTYRAPAP
jgi:cellulose synthase/poly-beta-1,6-N-acetylglucosamine synthase-like glycosyltransferase/spore germination protein YaaH/peptidoglycan/xylan/chitin deacetylase (PgdA/CDA1 family)